MRKRDVQEETDRTSDDAELAQLRSERDEMVIMNPDQIIGAQQRQEALGKPSIHSQVCVVLFDSEMTLAWHVVKQRPQRTVGEAVVVRLEIRSRERK